MKIRPITLRAANAFVTAHHRHHGAVTGAKFALCLKIDDKIVGVAIVGRPVARRSDDGLTIEVNRLCTDGTPNAASKLYAAARRVAGAMGYERVITYTLEGEPGTSLFAAGWKMVGLTRGDSWSVPTRPRTDKHPLGIKKRWQALTSATAAKGVM